MDGSWNGCMARRPVLCSIPRGWITTNRQSFVPLREERAGQSPEGVLVLAVPGEAADKGIRRAPILVRPPSSSQGTGRGEQQQQGAGRAGIKPPGSRTSRNPTRENPRCKRRHAPRPLQSPGRGRTGRTDGRLRCVGQWRARSTARAERQAGSTHVRRDATRRRSRPQCNDVIGGQVASGRAARSAPSGQPGTCRPGTQSLSASHLGPSGSPVSTTTPTYEPARRPAVLHCTL
jgi:hypothetical protein